MVQPVALLVSVNVAESPLLRARLGFRLIWTLAVHDGPGVPVGAPVGVGVGTGVGVATDGCGIAAA
jgi:hypothetical protein